METKCTVCGKKTAIAACDSCGAALCDDCRKLEIWGSGAEDLTARYFCPACKDAPVVTPWGACVGPDAGEFGGNARAA